MAMIVAHLALLPLISLASRLARSTQAVAANANCNAALTMTDARWATVYEAQPPLGLHHRSLAGAGAGPSPRRQRGQNERSPAGEAPDSRAIPRWKDYGPIRTTSDVVAL